LADQGSTTSDRFIGLSPELEINKERAPSNGN
jgi:hypothetical protein